MPSTGSGTSFSGTPPCDPLIHAPGGSRLSLLSLFSPPVFLDLPSGPPHPRQDFYVSPLPMNLACHIQETAMVVSKDATRLRDSNRFRPSGKLSYNICIPFFSLFSVPFRTRCPLIRGRRCVPRQTCRWNRLPSPPPALLPADRRNQACCRPCGSRRSDRSMIQCPPAQP